MKWEKLKPIVVLTAICLVVSAALTGTYNLTKPVIDAAKAAQANEALLAVLPDGTDFEEVPKMSLKPIKPVMVQAMYSKARARALPV